MAKVNKKMLYPMTEQDFIQLTLLANSIAIFQMVIKMEKQGSTRRREYAQILAKLKSLEHTIPGHLEDRTLDASIQFYNRMEDAVAKFKASFKDAKPVGRNAKGQFQRL